MFAQSSVMNGPRQLPFVAVRVNEHSKVIEGGGDFRNVNPLGYVPALVLETVRC